jgi:hypothetical protein
MELAFKVAVRLDPINPTRKSHDLSVDIFKTIADCLLGHVRILSAHAWRISSSFGYAS